MNLIFDFGNSLTKYFFIQDDKVIDRGSFISNKFDDNILAIKNKRSIEKLIYSSVIDDKRDELSSIFKNSKIISLRDMTIKLPFTNEYKSETLGDDRVALVSAGLNLYPNKDLLIIDIGTTFLKIGLYDLQR